MLKYVTAAIKTNEKIANGIYRMALHCPDADLEHFVPGQFAHVKVPTHPELLLGRPISINVVDIPNRTIVLVYQLKGKGTAALAKASAGTAVEAVVPVGRGFNLKSTDKTVFLVGGGVGIAPLLTVIQKWPDRHYEAFLGYRGKDYAYCENDFGACDSVNIASDDGTIGMHGLVTVPIEQRLKELVPDVVLSCGPPPMLRALKALLEPLHVAAQVSMEQRMCCGFGACATCVCGVHTDDGLDYKKVCVEGPVFDLYEVAL